MTTEDKIIKTGMITKKEIIVITETTEGKNAKMEEPRKIKHNKEKQMKTLTNGTIRKNLIKMTTEMIVKDSEAVVEVVDHKI